HVATGSVDLQGIAKEDETLSVVLSNVADSDGLDQVSYSYQWYADNQQITGATDSSYQLTQQEVGKRISVKVMFHDDAGNLEVLSSTESAAVVNVNDPASGHITLTGEVKVGEIVTVDPSAIVDEDGFDQTGFNYQWYLDNLLIENANNVSYSIKPSDVNKSLHVSVSFVDNYGSQESLSSQGVMVQNVDNTAAQGSIAIAIKVVNANDFTDIDYYPVNNSAIYEEDTYSVDVSDITDADGVG
ncbi:hypothetical protein, partial [Cysteiniphilum litorale]|uniref:hypothetical protein n=1 Tax=Cysteiniphilum litorale TaxID=2056700 RepID=UPI003F88313E